jgi:hypothetical protein
VATTSTIDASGFAPVAAGAAVAIGKVGAVWVGKGPLEAGGWAGVAEAAADPVDARATLAGPSEDGGIA